MTDTESEGADSKGGGDAGYTPRANDHLVEPMIEALAEQPVDSGQRHRRGCGAAAGLLGLALGGLAGVARILAG